MNKIEIVEDGGYDWIITDCNSNTRICESHHTFSSREECLADVFNVLFGVYDTENMMGLYSEWQASLPKDQRFPNAATEPAR